VVDVTVVGKLDAPPLLRSGARAGDELWVTGKLGGPGAALSSWKSRLQPDEAARERFALPVPRVNEARWLRDHGARAMIDLSDGLAADATHIAAASGVRCLLREELVPVHPSAESEEAAVVSGEEYELLCVLPAGSSHLGAAFVEQFNLPLTRVGTIEAGEGVTVSRGGQAVEPKPVFRHFR
jgi:thiamine-monophosphate kinase